MVTCGVLHGCSEQDSRTLSVGNTHGALMSDELRPTSHTGVAGAQDPQDGRVCGYEAPAALSAGCTACMLGACCDSLEACRADTDCDAVLADYLACSADDGDPFGACFEGLALTPGASAGTREVAQCLRVECLGCR